MKQVSSVIDLDATDVAEVSVQRLEVINTRLSRMVRRGSNSHDLRSQVVSGISSFLSSTISAELAGKNGHPIVAQSSIIKLKTILKNHRVFMDSHPYVRNYAMKEGRFLALGMN